MPASERNSNRQPPWDENGERDAVPFGTWLRRQREIREIPLREIADTTKISIRYLEALETERFDILPAPVFAKGFLREYASYVGIDPDEAVNSYLTAQQEATGDEPEAEADPLLDSRLGASGFPFRWALILLIGILSALLIWLYYWRSREASPQPPPIAAPVLPPAPVPPEDGAEASSTGVGEVAGDAVVAAAPLTVILDFTEDCWVEVEVDGQRRLSELHVQGESMRLEAENEVVLTLGNPGGVRVEANGSPYPFDFSPGAVARNLVIDLASATGTDPTRSSTPEGLAAAGEATAE